MIVVSKLRFSRSDMIATPWSPMLPDRRIASPGRARSPEMSMPGGTTPMPIDVRLITASKVDLRDLVLGNPDFLGGLARASLGMANVMNRVGARRWLMEKALGKQLGIIA